jgi:hypothetical protein
VVCLDKKNLLFALSCMVTKCIEITAVVTVLLSCFFLSLSCHGPAIVFLLCYLHSACSYNQYIIQPVFFVTQHNRLLNVSAPRCHQQGAIATNMHKPTCQYNILHISCKHNQNAWLLKYIKLIVIMVCRVLIYYDILTISRLGFSS